MAPGSSLLGHIRSKIRPHHRQEAETQGEAASTRPAKLKAKSTSRPVIPHQPLGPLSSVREEESSRPSTARIEGSPPRLLNQPSAAGETEAGRPRTARGEPVEAHERDSRPSSSACSDRLRSFLERPFPDWESPDDVGMGSLDAALTERDCVVDPDQPDRTGLSERPAPMATTEPASTPQRSGSADDADAITPAPAPKSRREKSSISAGSTLVGGDIISSTFMCRICGTTLGEPKKSNGKIEELAFLPCGHAYGHECLFLWIPDPSTVRSCLTCQSPLRHKCEHRTVPTHERQVHIFADSNAAVIPWNYEFCVTLEGIKLHGKIDRDARRLMRAERRWRNSPEGSAWRYGLRAVRRYHMAKIEVSERVLDERQRSFWKASWSRFLD
ncbi:hypothetical protein CDD83_1695 [Cordyceps sp. RAO-2017]|nr:hypothetical protein CDD83_1695 [Cordyceps sp. RAO-2017]